VFATGDLFLMIDAEQKYQINNQLFSWSGSISAIGVYYLQPGAASA
jgi:hypothetical protein